MQRIERYGVIALVLLLVTIAAVSFWDEGGASEEPVAARTPEARTRPAGPRARAPRPTLPRPEEARSQRREVARTEGLPAVAPARRSNPSPVARQAAARKGTEPAPARAQQEQLAFRELPTHKVEAPRPAPVERAEPEPLVVPPYDQEASRSRREATRTTPPAVAGVVEPRRNESRQPEPRRIQPAPAPEGAAASARTYTVRAGDSLSRITERQLGSVSRMSELMALNGLSDPNRIFVGQELRLPSGSAPVVAASTPSRAASQPAPASGASAGRGDGAYVVRAGEVLGAIAQRELGRASRYTEIVALNPGLDPDRITEGQRLSMPADWTGSSSVASVLPRTTARRSTPASSVRRVR